MAADGQTQPIANGIFVAVTTVTPIDVQTHELHVFSLPKLLAGI